MLVFERMSHSEKAIFLREGYISTKPNIKAVFPFKEDGLVKDDIIKLLEDSGLGLPKYYEWCSRSGCPFCFYQRKIEWIGLYENHPDPFEDAKKYEKYNEKTGKRYTWSQDDSLDFLERRTDLESGKKDRPNYRIL